MIEILDERYRLGEVLGSGGMGAVYRATDLRLGRTVAIKILSGGVLADDVARSRMRSEAVLAASIHHPGVAQVFDFQEASVAHGGLSYIVMELVEGRTLAQVLQERGVMPVDQVLSAVVQVAEGLQIVHETGIVHRDLKPSNILLTPEGRTVLVDFGIARSATSEPLTSTGSMVGTVEYMSPEQAAGRSATPASDLYALGVVAYRCLSGTSPFRRETHVATAMAHLNEPLPPLPAGVPPDVDRLVRTLTAKDPADRPPSAVAVAHEATRIGAPGTISLPAVSEQPAAVPRRRRRRSAVYAGVSSVVLVLAVLGVQGMSREDPTVVPSVVGLDADEAAAEIHDAGMSVSRRAVDVAGQSAGQVVKQSPEAGDAPPEDGPVTIAVASGKIRVSAADVIGTAYVKAASALAKLGFEVRRKDVSRSRDAGTVVAMDRSGRLLDGSIITLSVAVPPPAATTASRTAPSASSESGQVKGDGNARKHKGKGKK